MSDRDVDAELRTMWVELMRVREQAAALGFEMLVYLVGMCIEEVRLKIAERQEG